MKGANSPWSCGDVVKRVDLRRGFCFVARFAYAVATVAMGNITVIRIGLGKTRRLRRERGKRASNGDRLRRRLTQCAKEGRKRGGSSSTAAEVCFLPRKFGMDHRNRPRAEKRQSISGSSSEQAQRNRTELLQCFVGSLSEGAGKREGREGGAHAIKVRSRYADDCCCFHSVPCCDAEAAHPLSLLFPLYDWTETKGTNRRTNGRTARFMARKIGYQSAGLSSLQTFL